MTAVHIKRETPEMHRYTEERPCEYTQHEGGHPKAKGLWRKQTCKLGILDFKPLKMLENKFLLFKPPSMWYFVTAALAD